VSKMEQTLKSEITRLADMSHRMTRRMLLKTAAVGATVTLLGRRWARAYAASEAVMLALPGMFIPNPDSQHGNTKMFTISAAAEAKCGPMWLPPHPTATTYEVAMSHAWADGRLFIRGNDAAYCYDLRVPPRK